MTSTQEPGRKLTSGLRSPLCAHRLPTKLRCCGPLGSPPKSAHLSCRGMPSAKSDQLMVLFCVPVFRIMGRDYDAAVMGGGFIGFMLGTTANAMAVMRTLVLRYGMAPRAFLVAPLVGAFFIDFTNALIITGFLNFWP